MTRNSWSVDAAVQRLTPEFIDLFLKAESTPIELEPESGDWVHCREARAIVADAASISLTEAEQALCLRAGHWVPVKVNTFSRSEEPLDYIDRVSFLADSSPIFGHFSPYPLPRSWRELRCFFEAIRDFEAYINPCGVRYANWGVGDFCVKLAEDFSEVTMEISGLHFDRPSLLRSLGLAAPLPPTPATRAPIDESTIIGWIANCGTENSKEAWKKISAEFQRRRPKKETFDETWRKVKGARLRGRPRGR